MSVIKTKDEALEVLEVTRSQLIERFRIRFLERLKGGPCSVVDVRDEIPIPPDIDARFLGAVHRGPLKEGLIEFVEYRRTSRPDCHGRPVSVWRLASGLPNYLPKQQDVFSQGE